ncbi:MAG: hypothetical protein AAGD96_20020 [Chloroflexota bacterium]
MKQLTRTVCWLADSLFLFQRQLTIGLFVTKNVGSYWWFVNHEATENSTRQIAMDYIKGFNLSILYIALGLFSHILNIAETARFVLRIAP